MKNKILATLGLATALVLGASTGALAAPPSEPGNATGDTALGAAIDQTSAWAFDCSTKVAKRTVVIIQEKYVWIEDGSFSAWQETAPVILENRDEFRATTAAECGRTTPPVATQCKPPLILVTIAGSTSCQPPPRVTVPPAPTVPNPAPVQGPKPPPASIPPTAISPIKPQPPRTTPGSVLTGGGIATGGVVPRSAAPAAPSVVPATVAPAPRKPFVNRFAVTTKQADPKTGRGYFAV